MIKYSTAWSMILIAMLCLKKCVHSLSHVWLTLCHPMDCGSPGSSRHGSFQASTLEWIAIFFSRDLHDPTLVSWLTGIFFGTAGPGKPWWLSMLCLALFASNKLGKHFSCMPHIQKIWWPSLYWKWTSPKVNKNEKI